MLSQTLAGIDPEVWFALFALIRNKKGQMERAPKPNILQRRMFEHYRNCCIAKKPCKMVILKPRQCGASTGAQAIIYHHQRKHGSLGGSLMGDISGTSDKVYEIYRRFAENDTYDWGDGLPQPFTPNGNQADDIKFVNGSTYVKETAGSKNAGRGGTIQVASMTEVAFWQNAAGNDPALAYLNSFYDDGEVSLAIADSTPNGPQGWFYDTCTKDNGWEFIFAAWFEFEEHTTPFVAPLEAAAFEVSLTEDEKLERTRFGVSLEQLNWRRKTLRDKCGGSVDKFRQEYPSDAQECFLKSSRPRFHLPVIDKWVNTATDPDRGYLNNQKDEVTFVPDQSGTVERWENPRPYCRYLVSVDTCTGEDQQQGHGTADPDYHAVHVWRAEWLDPATGMQHPPKLVARHHSRLDIDVAADEVALLAAYYGNCLIIPEVNNCGLAMVKRLVEKGCLVFQRKSVDQQTSVVEKSYGWRTDSVTRKTIVDNLASAIRESRLEIPCRETLMQMRSFVVNAGGRPEAMRGFHDDDVLAAAIGVYNLSGATEMKPPRRKKFKLPEVSADGFRRMVGV